MNTILWENVHMKKRIDKVKNQNIFLIMACFFHSECLKMWFEKYL